MGQVDPDDDTIERYLVRHYRYDPVRHERRHVVVAAYDTEAEFDARIDAERAALRQRIERKENVHRREDISGVVHAPGHRARAAKWRMIRRSFAHGVGPAAFLDDLALLPNGMWVLHTPEPATDD